MFTKAPSTGTATTHVAIKYRADASSSGNMGFFTFSPDDAYYPVPVTADGQWHTAIVAIDGSKFGAGFTHYRVDFFDGQQAECADKSIDIAYVNFYTSEAEANAAAQQANLLDIADSYIGASIRKTLVAYDNNGIVNQNDKRQGLRFCFEDIAKVGEQIQYGGRTVTVTGVKGLIALQDQCTADELVLGSKNTNVKTLDKLIAWELGGQKYASSYIYNIPQENKDTVIISRVVVTATGTDGIEYKIYSDIQSASVSSVYAAAPNAGLDAEASAWFAVG